VLNEVHTSEESFHVSIRKQWIVLELKSFGRLLRCDNLLSLGNLLESLIIYYSVQTCAPHLLLPHAALLVTLWHFDRCL
jgi:hypothetical protein